MRGGGRDFKVIDIGAIGVGKSSQPGARNLSRAIRGLMVLFVKIDQIFSFWGASGPI